MFTDRWYRRRPLSGDRGRPGILLARRSNAVSILTAICPKPRTRHVPRQSRRTTRNARAPRKPITVLGRVRFLRKRVGSCSVLTARPSLFNVRKRLRVELTRRRRGTSWPQYNGRDCACVRFFECNALHERISIILYYR